MYSKLLLKEIICVGKKINFGDNDLHWDTPFHLIITSCLKWKKGREATFETKGNTPNSKTFFEKNFSKGDDLFDMQSDKNH